MTFSISQKMAKDINTRAKREKRSKSAIIDEIYREYRFNKGLRDIQLAARPIMLKHGLKTDDDVYDFAYDQGRFAKNKKHATKA